MAMSSKPVKPTSGGLSAAMSGAMRPVQKSPGMIAAVGVAKAPVRKSPGLATTVNAAKAGGGGVPIRMGQPKTPAGAGMMKPTVGGVALGGSSKVPAGAGMMKPTTVTKTVAVKKPAVAAVPKPSAPAAAPTAPAKRSSGGGNVLHNAARSLMGATWGKK